MFRPVGSQSPSVYWRRRLLVLGSTVLVIVLIVVTVKAITGGSGQAEEPAGAGGASTGQVSPPVSTPQTTAANTRTRPATSAAQSSVAQSSVAQSSPAQSTPARSSGTSSAQGSATRSATGSTPARVPVAACKAADLAVKAVVGKTHYEVGDQPKLVLQVTNVGAKPCVQDLADKQVVLSVYNGESRVWGSHDCHIEPGKIRKTLAVGAPVRVSITWSGLTSHPDCAGTRQRVGAGAYTLYAKLSGKTGKAAQFTIS